MWSPRYGICANGLGQPGRFPVEDTQRRLRRDVPRGEACSSCCQNEQRPGLVDESPDGGLDLSGIVGYDDSDDVVALLTQKPVERISTRVLSNACVDAVGDRQDRRVHAGSFVFSTSSTSPIVMPLSTAFAMSYTVRAAIVAATSASISTPVCALVSADASISTASATTVSRTSTWVSERGWQRGMSSDVRLAAMTPAICAVSSASPFGSVSSVTAVSGAMRTVALATARRRDVGFPPTSTMWTFPWSPTWLSLCSGRSVTWRSYVQRFHVKTGAAPGRSRQEGRA